MFTVSRLYQRSSKPVPPDEFFSQSTEREREWERWCILRHVVREFKAYLEMLRFNFKLDNFAVSVCVCVCAACCPAVNKFLCPGCWVRSDSPGDKRRGMQGWQLVKLSIGLLVWQRELVQFAARNFLLLPTHTYIACKKRMHSPKFTFSSVHFSSFFPTDVHNSMCKKFNKLEQWKLIQCKELNSITNNKYIFLIQSNRRQFFLGSVA